jgi:molybdopterin synthase catalytic subunit
VKKNAVVFSEKSRKFWEDDLDDSFRGVENRGMIEITQERIDASKLLELATDESCGATVMFLGTTRRWTGDTETSFLEYEAYADMAKEKMIELAQQAQSTWPIKRLCVVHRIGRVELKEPSVAIVVSTPHRAEAFQAGQWLIDELKKQVPIWKKEWFADRPSQWVHPTLPS